MSHDIGIFINSSGRPDGVKTLGQFPESWKEFTHIVVPAEQAVDYRNALDWPVLALRQDVPNFLPPQRQCVVEMSEYRYVFMMDDDLTFERRTPEMKLKRCKHKSMKRMLSQVAHAIQNDGVPLVGISTHLGNNRVTEDYTENTRVTRCYCVDKEVFTEVGVNFAPVDDFVMEDFHMNLCLLEAGHGNRVYYNFSQGDSGSNSDGGCSEYRDAACQKRAALLLKELHPEFVTVKEKRTKASWPGFPKDSEGYTVRTDVIVHWKKAFAKGTSKGVGIASFMGD